jgi:hypothetical protein
MRILIAILFALVVNNSTAAAEESSLPRTIVLVPAVRHGHSIMWKTGAIITVASVGVSLLGAALVVSSMHGDITEGSGRIDQGPWIAGLVLSVVGDGGVFIGGPVTWMSGIGGDPSSR